MGRSRSRSRERDRDRDRGYNRDRRDRDRDRDRDRRDDRKRDEPPAKKPKPALKEAPKIEFAPKAQNPYLVGEAGAEPGEKKTNEPVSLEDRLKQLKETREQSERPVFLTKEERQKLALEKLQAQRAEQRASRESDLSRARDDYRDRDFDRYDRYDRDRDRDRKGDRRPKEDAKKVESFAVKGAVEIADGVVVTEQELQKVKARYLGEGKVKKKVVKMTDKFRFAFDWEESEDTSKDVNPLYQNRHEAQLLFGRGLRAGIDMREQKKSSTYVEHLETVRERIEDEEYQNQEMEEQKAAKEEEKRRLQELYANRAKASQDKTMKLPGKHWSEKSLEAMSIRDWRIFREDFQIACRGGKPVNPIRNWEESGLPEQILDAIREKKYKTPSAIQMQCIPFGLQNRDVVGIAQTGSGKTAAFVIPMLVYISKQPEMTKEVAAEGPYSVVLAPSRELANQIHEEAASFCKFMKYRAYALVGGGGVKSIEEQSFTVREGIEMLIASPGRLIDCLERRLVVLNQCNYIVLDEADRMIDMGFEPQVQQILDAMPFSNMKPEDDIAEEGNVEFKYRQTFMFSATMPPAVERITRKYLRRPAFVTIGEAGQTATTVDQNFIFCSETQKLQRVTNLLRKEKPPIMVFVNARKSCDVVYRDLSKEGLRVTLLHGGKTQEGREQALADFKEGVYDIIVCTDVAGRGIDISGVEHVVNYDCPKNIEDYTHRIGRTGRAGKSGVATTLLTPDDTHIYYDLKHKLEEGGQTVPNEIANNPASRSKDAPTKRKDQVQYVDVEAGRRGPRN